MNAQCEAITTPLENSDSLMKRLLKGFGKTLQQRRERRIDRDAFTHLNSLDDNLLKDIGVTREDVQWAMNLPLSQNASDALQLVSRGYVKRS